MQTVRDLDRANTRNVGQLAPNTMARVVDVNTGKGASVTHRRWCWREWRAVAHGPSAYARLPQ